MSSNTENTTPVPSSAPAGPSTSNKQAPRDNGPSSSNSALGMLPAPSNIATALNKSLQTADTISVPLVKYDSLSWHFPCSIVLFEILFQMDQYINNNDSFIHLDPSYFSLPVRIYYSVLFYVQILRSMTSIGKATFEQKSWLRMFSSKFSDASLPIAGPLVPFFCTLCACLCDSAQYDFVYAKIPSFGTYKVHKTVNDKGEAYRKLIVDPTNFLFPSVPILVSLLRKFCITSNLESIHFNDLDVFCPFNLSAETAQHFAGIDIPVAKSTEVKNSLKALLSNPALSQPFVDDKFRLANCHHHWRLTDCRRIPEISNVEDYDPMTCNEFTMITKNSFKWFKQCIKAASAQSRFFKHTKNLSHIPSSGDVSSLVISTIKIPHHPKIPQGNPEWYPCIFDELEAKFQSATPKLELLQQRIAAVTLSNAILEWKTSEGFPIGSLEAGHREGPYYEKTEVFFATYAFRSVLTKSESILQSQFFLSRPDES